MRDILTVIAALVIAVLTAAVAVPPFVDWGAHRAAIDGVLARAAGTEARTEGRIELRLLPSPRIQVDALQLGGSTSNSPSLQATGVVAEIALMPLLSGHVRITDTRLGRAEIRVPTGAGGNWRLPSDLPAVTGLRREWAIENLAVRQLFVTATTPSTGRTDQFFAENVRIEGQSLIGPWRAEGMTGGVPFRFATGELASDQTVQVKLAGGGDVHPRFDIEAKLAFENEANAWVPSVSGTAKILFGPPAQVSAAGVPIPVTIQAGFKTTGGAVELEPVAVEAGEGGASLRLTGAGVVRIDDPRISLKLEGRRLDVDSFLLSASGRELVARAGTWSLPPVTVPIDLDLSLNSIGLAQEELSNLAARFTLDRGRAQVERIEVEAPGQTRVMLAGEVGLTTQGGANGRVAVTSAASDRFARYLAKLGVTGAFGTFLDGRRLEAAADVIHSAPVTSFRNVRVALGESTLTGNARYTEPEASARGRLEAQIALHGVDLARLPQMSSLFEATPNLDIGFILDAQDVRHGGSKGAGRISARILSDAPSLVVETLEITDLAGANARVSGRIEPDGSGRIAGRVTAERAAPLVDLLGSVWIGGVSKFVPHFLREGELNIDVVAERAAPSQRSGGLRLKTVARGTAAGGLFEAEVLSADGFTENLNLRLATENTGLWVDRPDAVALRRPSHLDLRGVRVPSGNFNVTVAGDVGGVRVNTTRPIALGAGDDVIDSGEADLNTADITPFLVLLGDGAGVEPPVPAQLRVTLGRERDASLVMLSGRVADAGIQARLWGRTRSEVSGTVTAERLSMPWLAAAFALNAPPDPRATALWSTARFGQTRRVLNGGDVTFSVGRLDLGRDLVARDATFALGLTPDGIAVRDFKAALAGGDLTGGFTIGRQGSLASIAGEGAARDLSLSGLSPSSAFAGKVSGTLKFGASGETMSTLVANLAGAGTARITDLEVANADPSALERSIARALNESDPLAARRLETIASEELGRGPLRGQVLSAPTTLIGGALRISPFIADAGAANWQGAVSLDFKTLAVEARGALSAKTIPKGWTGNPPYVHLGWRGSLDKPVREIDVAPLVNGLASIVLQRELEKIEIFEADANERARMHQRRLMDWSREQARQAEEAARQREEEAARHRVMEEARRRAEEARQVRLRQQQQQEERARPLQNPYIPLDIRPPVQNQQPPG
ncbi:MAG TPA: AsmA family protein [Beijerinckiaceae bacterium]